MENLERGQYVEILGSWQRPTHIKDISERALRETRAWPTPESALDRMIDALEVIAASAEHDEDTRSWARKSIDVMRRASGQIGISVASAVITGQIT